MLAAWLYSYSPAVERSMVQSSWCSGSAPSYRIEPLKEMIAAGIRGGSRSQLAGDFQG
jgi:hypothetical protein